MPALAALAGLTTRQRAGEEDPKELPNEHPEPPNPEKEV
jgi:hypothetical protein